MAVILERKLIGKADLRNRDAARRRSSTIYSGWLTFAGLFSSLLVIVVIATIVYKGAPSMTWSFLTSDPIKGMSAGGIWPMIRGSLLLMLGTLAIVLPLGVFGGICLAEYAGNSKLTGILRGAVVS